MNKWVKTMASAALASCILLAGTSAYAASPVYVNGHYQQSITTPEGKVLVKLRVLKDPGWLVFAYDSATHTVTAHTKDNSVIVSLREGEKKALVNGKEVPLDTAVVNKNGLTYVPLRFLSETLGLYVHYFAEDNHVIVRTPAGQADYETMMSGDLTEARKIALSVDNISTGHKLEPLNVEGWHTTTHIFPVGEALRFSEEMLGVTSFYRINEEGLAILTGEQDPDQKGGWGTSQADFGNSYYFIDGFMGGLLQYGKVDEKWTELGRIYDSSEARYPLVMPIEGEMRKDSVPQPDDTSSSHATIK
ncbi:copper amine oxidase N-terminal domain-containing protein [Paenibacillus nasutitermitis]|uniref:Copper amine oxidase-like N-terminal domain-containing protein n=1 Tax=Paenibacillus nasutitermitis TaxID=1652958 RepID=A0A916YUT3_9BACL|nr:copper amine oxidase N-terminal domain-containing protein [Paenibacillus nasutitermitis]GGD62344.1 hypothetical protein GCM10010911_20300 [Paenibacillus nasutitermitis]